MTVAPINGGGGASGTTGLVRADALVVASFAALLADDLHQPVPPLPAALPLPPSAAPPQVYPWVAVLAPVPVARDDRAGKKRAPPRRDRRPGPR